MDPVESFLSLHCPSLGSLVLPRHWSPQAIPVLSFLICEGSLQLLAVFSRQDVLEAVGVSIQKEVLSGWMMKLAGIHHL